MELWMAYDVDLKLNGLGESEMERPERLGRPERGWTVRSAAPGRVPGKRGRRFARFEPITVRAAARVLRLQREGVVSAREARFYLGELAAMDRYSSRGAYRSLERAARRHQATPPVTRTHGERPEREQARHRESRPCATLELPALA